MKHALNDNRTSGHEIRKRKYVRGMTEDGPDAR